MQTTHSPETHTLDAHLFDEAHLIHELKHYLPAQASLKDFVHHNTLHAFQDRNFHEGLKEAKETFGYKTYLSLSEFRRLYEEGQINPSVLERVVVAQKGEKEKNVWLDRLLNKSYQSTIYPRIGNLRANWKTQYDIDLDASIHPLMFRLLCSYLDQGIAIWEFPVKKTSFLAAVREMEKSSVLSLFRTKTVRKMLIDNQVTMYDLLKRVVGDESLFEQYVFDQQFAHQGWSGMVSVVESQPETLLDTRKISLHDLIMLELLLEIDTLTASRGDKWKPLGEVIKNKPTTLFQKTEISELDTLFLIWQEAFEWSYYDQVLAAIQQKPETPTIQKADFQAVFCIDDRECSIRRYLEKLAPNSATFGTPGFFGTEFFYQPQDGKFYTKVCPAPVTPKYLIKEYDAKSKHQKDFHFSKHTHNFFSGWFVTQTLGFWAAFKLFLTIFRPTMEPAAAYSLKHMDRYSNLTILNPNPEAIENGLQIGFNVQEMATRVENTLRSIGLIKDFAPIVYIIGHGASSVNNPHYAAYDCGACSGRAGSVNARVFSFMANHPQVREMLAKNGVVIPASTQFVGAIRDTTRDEIEFFDEASLNADNQKLHRQNEGIFAQALDLNAKERSRRFESIDTSLTPKQIHDSILKRSVSLFEPRPELNHATNALCIVGRRDLSKHIFLDRRSFLNSYDYRVDPDGKYLLTILNAAAPVCGGINLEYYFSRVDNQKLGAGTKLPHNVMGLFGVANGIDGDLRPGLPSQMIEVHDPVRLLMIVEHYPEVALDTIKRNPATYAWFEKEWVNLIIVHPETKALHQFKSGELVPYQPILTDIPRVKDMMPIIESSQDNIPVHIMNG